MKNILRFISRYKLAVLGVICLLIAQAYCDLSLPNYTSDILNVGLQQGGIEDAVTKTIRRESLSDLELFMPEEDVEIVEAAFSEPDADGIRSLNKGIDRKKVDKIMATPEAVIFQMSQSEEMPFTIDDIRMAIGAGMMTKEQLQENMADALSKMEDLTDTYINQIAVNYVSQEYAAQGVNLNSIRNHYLLITGLKMLLMTVLMMVIAIIIGYIASRVAAGNGRYLREQMYAKVLSFNSKEMETFSTASLITRATNDIQQVQMVIVIFLRMVAYAPILAIGGVLKVVKTNMSMGWIIVLAVLILFAVFLFLLKVALPKFKIMQKLVDKLNLISREILTGIMPIRAFSREKHEEERFDEANQDLFKTQLFTNRAMTFLMPIMMFVMNGVSVLIVWIGGHKIDQGTLQIGDLTAFITYSMVIVMSFLMLGMISIILPRASIAADRIAEVLDTEVSLKDPENPKDEILANSTGLLEFHDVSFRYPGAEEDALEHISFTAKPGETTAIIGSTGCGKTTLLNLIPRFFDVTEGSITVDGVDIREISQHRLHDYLGYVPQKGVLFSGTIETNLKYGGEQITDEDMEEAAKIAQAADFIAEKADGYQSSIAQGGSNVSGGQRQRLSIARAIARHPQIYLFDDSFSALDYKTDVMLRKALKEKTGSATVLIVAQRISTILHADRILVLDEGRIVGDGTHDELMLSCKTYQEIARSQLSEAELNKKGGLA